MRSLAPLAACLLVVALPACSVFQQPERLRGIHVDADQLRELVPGTSTRADVTSLIGSPTAHATFDDNTWIYIGETTRPRIGRIEGIEAQTVYVMTFDRGGVLRSVQHLDKDNGQPVDMASQTTPSPGSEASFMQQLLGNIGRYNPTAGGGAGSGIGSSGSGLAGRR